MPRKSLKHWVVHYKLDSVHICFEPMSKSTKVGITVGFIRLVELDHLQQPPLFFPPDFDEPLPEDFPTALFCPCREIEAARFSPIGSWFPDDADVLPPVV